MQISAGKLWSMRRLADARGFFKMTAVDQRPGVEALVRSRRAGASGAALYADVGRIKRELIEALSPWSSALLLDPGYAYPFAAAQIDPRRGLLLTWEQWDCEETPGGRKTLGYPGWSVEKIKRLGADGVKLMLWWRPDASAEVRAHQCALVERIGAECRRNDIAFLLEPLLYPLASEAGAKDAGGANPSYAEDANKRPEMVLATAQEFRAERYGVDIFKLESPVVAHAVPAPDAPESPACQQWFDRLGQLLDRPWVMLSAGAAMEPFRRIVAHACRAGASGYLAGRAIWWPACAAHFPDWAALRAAVERDAVAYAQSLHALLEASATPWSGCRAFSQGLELAQAGADFYSRYPGCEAG